MIIIIDDEVHLREALENLLRSVGMTVESFSSAEEFLQSLYRLKARCLVLDIGLPGMSGLQLQQELALSGCRIPLIFMTANDDDDGRLQSLAMQRGALAFLRKPFVANELLKTIEVALTS